MDKSDTNKLLDFILESIRHIRFRFQPISCSDDFLKNEENLMRLDSISMRLQAIGEAVKNIYKKNDKLLLKVNDKKYWSKIIRTREILSHHYIDVDSEIIYEICANKLAELEKLIRKLKELND
ncbi:MULTISPECIES: DUF86 domain-containing protein [unclassified Lebetimonas]|uniref:HepT-like ribonuclease domain-containing protein n=1 Tax=unclassified Lebetimonas TaxID=2648158 RepID=UPI000464DC5C|nr:MULTISPECIES: HepT-like ribonuclease domain-containing protein [unclassified Lebetimonas]